MSVSNSNTTNFLVIPFEMYGRWTEPRVSFISSCLLLRNELSKSDFWLIELSNDILPAPWPLSVKGTICIFGCFTWAEGIFRSYWFNDFTKIICYILHVTWKIGCLRRWTKVIVQLNKKKTTFRCSIQAPKPHLFFFKYACTGFNLPYLETPKPVPSFHLCFFRSLKPMLEESMEAVVVAESSPMCSLIFLNRYAHTLAVKIPTTVMLSLCD